MSRLPLLAELQPSQVVDKLLWTTYSVHRYAEAEDMLALGSLLFLADVFPRDGPLLLSMPSSQQSPKKAQGQPDPTLCWRNAFANCCACNFVFARMKFRSRCTIQSRRQCRLGQELKLSGDQLKLSGELRHECTHTHSHTHTCTHTAPTLSWIEDSLFIHHLM